MLIIHCNSLFTGDVRYERECLVRDCRVKQVIRRKSYFLHSFLFLQLPQFLNFFTIIIIKIIVIIITILIIIIIISSIVISIIIIIIIITIIIIIISIIIIIIITIIIIIIIINLLFVCQTSVLFDSKNRPVTYILNFYL